MNVFEIQGEIDKLTFKERGQLDDTHHTFNELYEFRKMYNAVLFNEWGNPNTTRYFKSPEEFDGVGSSTGPIYNVHKSWKHHDGEWCFGREKEWFIVSAKLPTGLISNHYHKSDWDLFKIPEVEKALLPYDGHTGMDVLQRLKDL